MNSIMTSQRMHCDDRIPATHGDIASPKPGKILLSDSAMQRYPFGAASIRAAAKGRKSQSGRGAPGGIRSDVSRGICRLA